MLKRITLLLFLASLSSAGTAVVAIIGQRNHLTTEVGVNRRMTKAQAIGTIRAMMSGPKRIQIPAVAMTRLYRSLSSLSLPALPQRLMAEQVIASLLRSGRMSYHLTPSSRS